MATTKKVSTGRTAPAARRVAAVVKPALATTLTPPGAATSAAVGVGVGAALPLRPPLEAALDGFARELRKELDRAKTDIAALRTQLEAARTEVAALRQRYDAHTHDYQLASLGGGGKHWIELRFLQDYIDVQYPGFKNYGIWAAGKSTADGSPGHPTTGPST